MITGSFFFNDTATTEIYTLSLHDALPISPGRRRGGHGRLAGVRHPPGRDRAPGGPRLGHHGPRRSEEHTSELQSRQYLVCRLLLEKKKKHTTTTPLLYYSYFYHHLGICQL